MPPSVRDFVPEKHGACFTRDPISREPGLCAIVNIYTEENNNSPHHPVMRAALLLFGYRQPIYSFRRTSKACCERADFMAVTAGNQPDFRTGSDLCKRPLEALEGLFARALRCCQKAGLTRPGHVALDGTRVKACASKHKADCALTFGMRARVALAPSISAWLSISQRSYGVLAAVLLAGCAPSSRIGISPAHNGTCRPCWSHGRYPGEVASCHPPGPVPTGGLTAPPADYAPSLSLARRGC